FVLSYFFFFSSRRRHTRSKRDWSSDVCSSDLVARGELPVLLLHGGDLYRRSRRVSHRGRGATRWRQLSVVPDAHSPKWEWASPGPITTKDGGASRRLETSPSEGQMPSSHQDHLPCLYALAAAKAINVNAACETPPVEPHLVQPRELVLVLQ